MQPGPIGGLRLAAMILRRALPTSLAAACLPRWSSAVRGWPVLSVRILVRHSLPHLEEHPVWQLPGAAHAYKDETKKELEVRVTSCTRGVQYKHALQYTHQERHHTPGRSRPAEMPAGTGPGWGPELHKLHKITQNDKFEVKVTVSFLHTKR